MRLCLLTFVGLLLTLSVYAVAPPPPTTGKPSAAREGVEPEDCTPLEGPASDDRAHWVPPNFYELKRIPLSHEDGTFNKRLRPMTRWSPLEEQLASLGGVTFKLDSSNRHLLHDEIKDGIHFYRCLVVDLSVYDSSSDGFFGISPGPY